MKHKVVMLGLAMVIGVPYGVCAKGLGKEGAATSYSSWNAPYIPHYGAEGLVHPLMDHLSVPSVLPRRSTSNEWRLDFASLPAEARVDDPLIAKDKRVGVTFKLEF